MSIMSGYEFKMDEKTASIVKRARAKAAEYTVFADKVESGEITATEMPDGAIFCEHHPRLDQEMANEVNAFFARSHGRNRVGVMEPNLCPACAGSGHCDGRTCYSCDGQG